MKTENFKPPTKRQLWALYCITQKDWRSSGISFDEASQMISELNAQKGYHKQSSQKTDAKYYYDKLMSHRPRFDQLIAKQYKQVSIVGSDPAWDPDADKKPKYVFYGSGCGFAWLTFDKRKKKVAAEYEKARDAIASFRSAYMNELPENLKSSLGPMIHQDICVQEWLLSEIRDAIIEVTGYDKIYLESRLD